MTIDSKVGIVISILMSVYRLLVKMVALVWIHMGHTSANALIKWLVFIASTEWMTIFKFELNVALRGLTENELRVTFELSYLKVAEWRRKEQLIGLWLISLSCFYECVTNIILMNVVLSIEHYWASLTNEVYLLYGNFINYDQQMSIKPVCTIFSPKKNIAVRVFRQNKHTFNKRNWF